MTETSNRIQDVLNQTGLNWTVRQEALNTESGIVVPKQMAIVREDTNTVLSVHGDGYFDRVEGFITGVNSFDGSTSLAFGPSNITISCQNSFYAAFRNMDTKVRHTKNMIMRVDEICRGLEGVIREEAEMFEDIKKLNETRFSKETQEWVSKLLFNISREVNLNDADALSTVTQNRLSRFHIDLNGELKEKGDNLWGLFSGVTKYTTHSLTKGDNSENKMFGTYGQRERHIFRELVEMV